MAFENNHEDIKFCLKCHNTSPINSSDGCGATIVSEDCLCGGELVPVDSMAVNTLRLAHDLGFKTLFCCAGEYDRMVLDDCGEPNEYAPAYVVFTIENTDAYKDFIEFRNNLLFLNRDISMTYCMSNGWTVIFDVLYSRSEVIPGRDDRLTLYIHPTQQIVENAGRVIEPWNALLVAMANIKALMNRAMTGNSLTVHWKQECVIDDNRDCQFDIIDMLEF